MKARTYLALLCGAMLASACATSDGEDTAPDYAPIQTLPMTDNGRLILACLKQSMDTGALGRISDSESSALIRFTCVGAPATALFEALGPRSAEMDSEFTIDGVVHRSSEQIQENLYGADVCRVRASGGHECEINLNLGGFLNG